MKYDTAKYPSEVFGHPIQSATREATNDRSQHRCPFVKKGCFKKSRLLEYPFGVCSAHVGGSEIALCPRRFLDRSSVFADIALHHFGGVEDIMVFPEVQLKTAGNVDFVMVKHKRLSTAIEDFVVIELQTGQTTSTGKLVQGFKDFMEESKLLRPSYGFGLNLYDIWKRTFTQVLMKGVIMEHWGKKIYWVVQEPVFRDFERRYSLTDLEYDQEHSTVFALYDLEPSKTRFNLRSTRIISASIDHLFSSFKTNPNVPDIEQFHSSLEKRAVAQAQTSLRLDEPTKHVSIDVRPPTETGRVRDDFDEEQAE